MKNKLFIIIFSFLFAVSLFMVSVKAVDISNYREKCPAGDVSDECLPLQISDAQVWAVQLIGTAYAMGGLLFLGILIYNGAIYLIGTWEESKYILGASIEDVQKRMVQWAIGFFLFFLSWPFMNTLLKFVVSDNKCYDKLNSPVVMFIFPEVCNYVPQPEVTPGSGSVTPTGGVAPTFYPITITCDEVDKKSIISETQNELVCIPACTNNKLTGKQEFGYKSSSSSYSFVQCNCDGSNTTCIGFR